MRPDDLVHLACFSKLVRLNIDSLRGPVQARQINHLGRLTNLQELRILFAGHGLQQNLLVPPHHLRMHTCLSPFVTMSSAACFLMVEVLGRFMYNVRTVCDSPADMSETAMHLGAGSVA